MPDPITITFHAALPDILSAVNVSGATDGPARIKLDIPASDSDAVLLLLAKARGKPLLVTVEVLDPKITKMVENGRKIQF